MELHERGMVGVVGIIASRNCHLHEFSTNELIASILPTKPVDEADLLAMKVSIALVVQILT